MLLHHATGLASQPAVQPGYIDPNGRSNVSFSGLPINDESVEEAYRKALAAVVESKEMGYLTDEEAGKLFVWIIGTATANQISEQFRRALIPPAERPSRKLDSWLGCGHQVRGPYFL